MLASGSLLAISSCEDHDVKFLLSDSFTDSHDNPVLPSTVNEIRSESFCLTAGWPILTAMAFATPDNKNVAVIFNEADIDVSISFYTNDISEELNFLIAGRAIQSLIF